MAAASSDLTTGAYRQWLPDLSIPRFTIMKSQDAHVYANDFKEKGMPPWLHALYLQWRRLLQEPFKGVTNNDQGSVVPYRLPGVEDVVQSRIPAFKQGHPLDELTPAVRDAVLDVLSATLSTEGYNKAVSAMRINGFLGELVETPRVCNEYSYNFVLFGAPSTTTPWGFSFYGHHLCINIFFYRKQIVISPWFTGAEPNEIDTGPYAGTQILRVEEALGLQLMQSLPPDLQQKAQIYKQMKDPAMPPGRWNRDDQRHLCGAYRDNRVVPYEGILVSELPSAAQDLVSRILNEYFLFLPEQARSIRLQQAQSYFSETYFSWIGDYATTEAVFYYRIQSPVVIVEFDHHSGVFLTNDQPERFHVHTLLRTPNGGDYGMALRPLCQGEVAQDWIWEEDLK